MLHDDGASDRDFQSFKINVTPLQGQQFSHTQAGQHVEENSGPRRLAQQAEQSCGFLNAQDQRNPGPLRT